MPATPILDIDGSRFTTTNTNGTWDRRFRVVGIEATAMEAMFAEVLGVLPQPGDPAGAPYAGLLVGRRVIERIIGEPNQTTRQAEGVVTYAVPTSSASVPPPINDNGATTSISVRSFTEQEETATSVNPSTGSVERITVQDSDGLTRGVRVVVPKSRARITAVRKEINYPKSRIDTYTNRINLGVWNGYADSTIRVESIAADTVSGGNDWDVEYVFLFRPEGWDAIEVVGDDIATGKPIANPTGAQVTTVSHWERIDFDPLFISL